MKTYNIRNERELKKIQKLLERDTENLFKEVQEKAVWAVTSEALKDSNKFIPKDTGELERSGIFGTTFNTGKIEYTAPYARRLYYNPTYNFSKDANPNASAYWFEKGARPQTHKYRKIYVEIFNDTKKELF